jgi:DNA-binding CsgD family transcriptional regulator
MPADTQRCAPQPAPPRGNGPLIGREAEQQTIAGTLNRAHGGHSGALVLRGEPGIGKTALLGYATEQARGMQVLRCAGIEAERELPYAAIHQLVRGHLDLIDLLPRPQAHALRAALGLTLADPPDRFLISLGVLGLLEAIAREAGPTLCSVDDAHWLDRSSAQALAFGARRLSPAPIALLIATRDDTTERFESTSTPALDLRGLDDEHAAALLRSRLDRAPAPRVLATLLSTARGNPMALLELFSALSDAQLDGVEPILGPPLVGGAVREAFGARVGRLPEQTRLVLLLAAADESGDISAIERAGERMGVALADLEPAEQDGLLRVNGTITFCHPLLRSVVYSLATRSQRRAAHEALAAVLDDRLRGAWHRAVIAEGANEGIAQQLARGAAQAAARGAHAAASAAFERAAELSDDSARRGRRLRRAAQAALDAGRLDAALALVECARPLLSDATDATQLGVIRALEQSRRGSPSEAYALLQQAGSASADVAPEDIAVWSPFVALQSGHPLDASTEPGSAADPFAAGARALLAGDVTQARENAERAVAEARAGGSVARLAAALSLLAAAEISARRVKEAATTVAEALSLVRPLGFDNDEAVLLGLRARIAAFEGREEDCRQDAAAAIRRGVANGIAWATTIARLALAELELGLGNPRAAIEQLDQVHLGARPAMVATASSDYVDAALRLGEPDLAAAGLEQFASAIDGSLVQDTVARCEGQLAADGVVAERHFIEALDHDHAPPFERARTQLAYGERLRRDRRKIEARTQLRSALAAFEGLGAGLWAERARGELRATGETARRRDASTVDDLTPQELRIAALVADGASNRDVAAQLYVSTKTIEYHLAKVFRKCGVASRVELARMPLQLARA